MQTIAKFGKSSAHFVPNSTNFRPMTIHQNIRTIREKQDISQETMAEQLNMSLSGCGKIERGVTKLNMEKLQKIAQILQVDIIELINTKNKGVIIVTNDNFTGNSVIQSTYYEDKNIELEKLKLSVTHYQELLAQKDNEILALKEIILLLKSTK